MKRFKVVEVEGKVGELAHTDQDEVGMGHVSTLQTNSSRGPLCLRPDPSGSPATWPGVPRDPHSTAYT